LRRTLRIALLRTGLALLALGLAAALAAAGWLAATTPPLTAPAAPRLPAHPTAVEHWVNRAESRHDDIVPGTAARVIWADPYAPRRTDVAIVHLHGFAASRQETAPLVERLARGWDANAYEARLTGHGRDGAALAAADAEDWLGDALEALAIGRALGDQVLIVGSSTGATLAAWLATRADQEAVLGYVLLAPNLGPRDWRSEWLLLPGARTWVRWVVGPSYRFAPVNERHQRYWTRPYPSEALVSMMRLVDFVRDRDFSRVRRPVLTLYSQRDQVVRARAIEAWHERLGAPRKQLEAIATGDPARHVLAGEILSPTTTADVIAIVRDFFPGAGG
jgi:esterase/lipase